MFHVRVVRRGQILVFGWLLLRRLIYSPFGAMLTGIRENTARMHAVGAPVYWRLVLVYTLSATIAGIAGGGGLGEIMDNQPTYGLSGVLAAALCVSAVALLTAAVLGFAQRAAYRRMAPRT